MSQSSPHFADLLLDRHSLRRKLRAWRVLAVIAVIIAVGALGWRGLRPATRLFESHIARITIEGIITGDRETLELIDHVAQSNAAAVIVSIESPGGTTTGSERVYDELRRLAEKKPVVAVVRGMAASGAYIAALGTDHIIAQGNSLVGSIGVLFQFPNFAKLLDTVGVQVESVKSSPLKAAPSGVEPTSPEARAALAALVSDAYDWFKNLVKTRRAMSDAELAAVSDGRVFSGRQGIKLKLIDEIGDERSAQSWLEHEKNIPHVPIRDWEPKGRFDRFGLLGSAAALADGAGMTDIAQWLRRSAQIEQNHVLDGMLSLWQGGAGG
jgi:protease IV